MITCCAGFGNYEYFIFHIVTDNSFRLFLMQIIKKSLSYFLLWQLCICFSCLSTAAEEIDNLSIPLHNEEKLFPVTFKLTSATRDTTSLYAVLNLTDKNTAKKTVYLISTEKTLHLPAGEYIADIRAGVRRIGQALNFKIPLTKESIIEVELKPFANIEPTGWIMIDTFYNPPAAVSKTSLLTLAQALELRAIFTPLNNVLSSSTDYNILKQKDTAILAPITGYLHPEYGEVLAFNAEKPQAAPFNPTILDKPLFPLLGMLNDSNSLTAVSPVIYANKEKTQNKKYSEEFIFDTITGPLYDLFILNDFSSSLKVWHTLLNQGYRIPAVYIGGNNFYRKSSYPVTKIYAKIPRKEYSLKYLHNVLKTGRFILSNGPFIRFFTESIGSKDKERKTGQDNTDWINVDSLKIGGVGFTSGNLRNIYAEAFSSSAAQDNIKSLELIYNGKIIAKKIAGKKTKTLDVMWKVVLNKPGWVQLRYTSRNGKFHAITNPTYIVDYTSIAPTPVLAKTELHVVDAVTGKAIAARINVENFGVTIDSINLTDHAILLQTPATASISVEANGYINQTKNVYLDGGSAAYIRALNNKKLLPKAFISPITYSYLAKALQNSRLVFKLQKNKP